MEGTGDCARRQICAIAATRIPGYPSYVSVLVAAAHVISDEVADVICALNSPPPSGRTACQFLRRTAICRRASLRCRPYSPSLRNIVRVPTRHAGWDRHLLKASHAAYQSSRERNPRRWRGNTRNWTPVGVVTLNPERDAYVQAAGSQIQLSGSIGEPTFPSRPGDAQATRSTLDQELRTAAPA